MARIRLLICHGCESITPVPWCGEDYQCTHPSCVEPLEYRLADHIGHLADLADIDEETWDDPVKRTRVIRETIPYAKGTGKGAGLGSQFYDVKATFQDDAFTCWRRHNRTKNCADWNTDRMRLYPDTKADRKEAGLDPKTRATTFLCQYCPVTSIYMQRMRRDKYKYDYTE